MKAMTVCVALRKESVDRNPIMQCFTVVNFASLSARRAWIEIKIQSELKAPKNRRSPQGERG